MKKIVYYKGFFRKQFFTKALKLLSYQNAYGLEWLSTAYYLDRNDLEETPDFFPHLISSSKSGDCKVINLA